MNKIFLLYYKKVFCNNPRLLKNQQAVLYLDTYLIYISNAFLKFLSANYSFVILIFVLANCEYFLYKSLNHSVHSSVFTKICILLCILSTHSSCLYKDLCATVHSSVVDDPWFA